jgi:hypothetical protein
MEYELTEHARIAMDKRQILIEWMESTIAAPEVIERDSMDLNLEHRLARISEFGNHVLRVIVNTESRPPRIVTAFFDRRRTIP